ncbi:structural maintenance of chromosomes protein 1 [Aspergillus niger]|nr:structural maintenance of chromosomes protein 1 [Aspergillus niger]
MFARPFTLRAFAQQCPRSTLSSVLESSSPAWRYFSSSASRTKAASKTQQIKPKVVRTAPEDSLKFAGRRPEGFGKLERKVAKEGEIVLFRAPSQRGYVLGAYGIAGFCFAYAVYNSNAVFRDPLIPLPMWQQALFGGICVTMSVMGTVFLFKTTRLIRAIRAVNVNGHTHLRFTVRSVVPFRKPYEFDALPRQIAFSRRLVISPDSSPDMLLESIPDAPGIAGERTVAQGEQAKVSFFKAPFKKMSMSMWRLFRSVRQIFSQEDFILLEVEGQKGVLRMDSGGYVSQDFMLVGNPSIGTAGAELCKEWPEYMRNHVTLRSASPHQSINQSRRDSDDKPLREPLHKLDPLLWAVPACRLILQATFTGSNQLSFAICIPIPAVAETRLSVARWESSSGLSCSVSDVLRRALSTALTPALDFKSYKGHHVLLFGDAYFTSIIGPNGSGKSNSMDAISFVLGIKSSHLRSTNLRDLVYRGRVLRTSKVDASGNAIEAEANGDDQAEDGIDGEQSQDPSGKNDPRTAWVMAVYEDDAGEEQQWRRSITSGGVSEYRINNRIVTAQQYNEALEAENILIKARNFLVFQGDVEAIASQSPKDLTRLIEQISGSLEYKAEYERLKAEAEEAAEQQTVQLNRRRGINSEIKQYQEQKREAENYARKAEERDQAIITHILWKLFHFQRLIDASSADIQKYQDELKEFRRGVEKYEKNVEDAKKDHARVGRDVAKAEKNIVAKEKEIEEATNALVPVDEKVDITRKKVERFTSRIAEITREREGQATNAKQLEKDLKVVEKAQAQWEAERQKTMSKQGGQLSEADQQEYKRLREEVNKKSSAEQLNLDNLRRQRKTEAEAYNSLKSKFEGTEWQLKTLESETQTLSERKSSVTETVKSTSKEIERKKKELNALTSERLRVSQMRTELEEKLQVVLKKLLEADDGKKQSEKEIRAKELISTLKRIFPGVKGRVSDLCKPKQKKYSDAVSTVLGRHFDAIVVDNEKTAKECIQHLRDQRAGQATFIPLETIQVKAFNSNLKGLHRGMRPAIETVDYDDSVARAISYACGNAIVCDDLATAKYLCYDRNVDAKAVTLDGTVIHKGGLMTGGRGPQQNSKRWEDSEVENLYKLKDKLMADLGNLPKGHRRGTEEETLQGELVGLEQRLAYARDELKALERNLESKHSELDFVKRQLEDVRPKYVERQELLEELDQTIATSQETVSSVEDEVYKKFCKRLGYSNIREYEVQQGSLQEEAAQKKLEFTTQKSRIENQLSFEKQRLQATADRVAGLQAQQQRDEQLIEELQAEQESIRNQLDEFEAELDILREKLEKQKEAYAQSAENLAQHRRELQKRSREVEGTIKNINALEAEIRRNSSSRYALLRRCKLEDIDIPLTEDSNPLDQLPIDELVQAADPDAMDVDEDGAGSGGQAFMVQDYGIEVDFDSLGETLKEESDEKLEEELLEKVRSLNSELDKMAPNTRAMERLESVENKLKATEKDFEDSRKHARRTKDDFEDVMHKRSDLFNKAFSHISEQIGPIYRELTKSTNYPLGGQAYLDIEDSDEPYLDGIKYHAMPPLKRFRDMEHLSGGEKTMAALALLFAIHSYQPSPFFVLDEVDAALDNTNVARIANYIHDHAAPGMQFIVISLKNGLFQNSEALVGIYRDQVENSSKSLTLDLRKYN